MSEVTLPMIYEYMTNVTMTNENVPSVMTVLNIGGRV